MSVEATELESLALEAGFACLSGASIADRSYALPSKRWVVGDYFEALWAFQHALMVGKWKEEENDCDDFARMAAAFAQLLHHRTIDKDKATALAIGELWFQQAPGVGHAINIAVCGRHPDDVFVFEPQTCKRIDLTEEQKDHIYMIRF